MKIIKSLAIAAAIAGLAACGGRDDENAANMDANLTDMNAGMDMNATDVDSLNAADGMNATENAIVNDLTTNDADANLANGL